MSRGGGGIRTLLALIDAVRSTIIPSACSVIANCTSREFQTTFVQSARKLGVVSLQGRSFWLVKFSCNFFCVQSLFSHTTHHHNVPMIHMEYADMLKLKYLTIIFFRDYI